MNLTAVITNPHYLGAISENKNTKSISEIELNWLIQNVAGNASDVTLSYI